MFPNSVILCSSHTDNCSKVGASPIKVTLHHLLLLFQNESCATVGAFQVSAGAFEINQLIHFLYMRLFWLCNPVFVGCSHSLLNMLEELTAATGDVI